MAALGIPGLIRWIVGGLLLLIIAGAAIAYVLISPTAQIGGTYIAEQMCSCVFVAGRTEASCRAEFQPYIDRGFKVAIRHSKPGHGTVRTRLYIFSGAAKYTGGYGCTVTK
jgi:hypothetical protein